MKVLITGAAGFVASSLIDFFGKNDKNISLTGIDDFSYGYKERIKDLDFRFIPKDIKTFTEDPSNLENYDAIIHCAATAPLPDNEVDPPASYENNVVNTIRVADYASKIGCKKIIFFSSGAIYENDKIFPSLESTHHETTLVYPTSKMCAEHALNSYAKSYGLEIFALRLFNLYGPRQDYFRKQPPLIGYILSCLINDREATLFDSGNQRRDYIYIEDVYRIVKTLLALNTDKNFTPLNIGTGNTYSVNEIVKIICKIANKELKIKREEAKDFWNKYPSLFDKKLSLSKDLINKEVTKYSEANIDKLINLIGFKPKVSIEDGLNECYEYALKYFKN